MSSLSIRGAIVAALALGLGGCVFAPGMKVDQAHMPPVTEITPAVLASQAAPEVNMQPILAALGSPASMAYRIGPADVLSIGVLYHPELVPPEAPAYGDGRPRPVGFVVAGDGTLDYPYVGKLDVAGKALDEVRMELTAALSHYVRHPQIILRMADYRSQRVFVDGSVRTPGHQPMTDVPMTLALALADAGGILPVGDASAVEVTRGTQTYRVDIPALTRSGHSTSEIYLGNQDRVRVAERADRPVFVAGEVGQAKPVSLHDGALSLGEALAQAGSISQIGANAHGVYVVRLKEGASTPEVFKLDAKTPVGLAMASRFPLQPNDLVYVQTAELMRWNRVMNLFLSSSLSLYNTQRAMDGQ